MAAENEKIEELEKRLREKNIESLPFGLFIIGISLGIFSSLLASILYNKYGTSIVFIVLVLVIFVALVLLVYLMFKKAYGNPMRKLEQEIDELKRKKKQNNLSVEKNR